MSLFEEISATLQQGRKPKVEQLVQQGLDEGISPKSLLEEGLLPGMEVIGEKFKNNQVFVPEVLVAARAMNAGVAILKPYIAAEEIGGKGKVVIGTVKGDLHDIGKNLVKLMMEGRGLTVVDLGIDVPAETFVTAAIENDADVICCSALLTTTMNEMKTVVEKSEEFNIRDKVKIIIGGAPVTQSFCDSIGADSYTEDAATAADVALEYCSV